MLSMDISDISNKYVSNNQAVYRMYNFTQNAFASLCCYSDIITLKSLAKNTSQAN